MVDPEGSNPQLNQLRNNYDRAAMYCDQIVGPKGLNPLLNHSRKAITNPNQYVLWPKWMMMIIIY